MAILQTVISISLLLISIGDSRVYGVCQRFQAENTSLTERHIPPHVLLVQYSLLNRITEVNYPNVSEVYTKVVERHQSATTLKNIMAKRIGREVPPPHHHCFIAERNESVFAYDPSSTTDNHTARLIEDTVLLYNASKALQMMFDYERDNFTTDKDSLASSFHCLKSSLDNIIAALSNMTGVSVTEFETMTGSGDESSEEESSHSQGGGEEERSETTYSTNDRNHVPIPSPQNPDPTTPPPPPTHDPHSGDSDILNQRPSSQTPSRGRPVTQVRFHRAAGDMYCMAIGNDEDEFVFVYEIWLGLWYVQSDLLKIKEHLARPGWLLPQA